MKLSGDKSGHSLKLEAQRVRTETGLMICCLVFSGLGFSL